MIVILLAAVALAAAIAAPRWLSQASATRLEAWEGRLRKDGALVAGLVSVAVVWFTWDALVPVPQVHDEVSYLLQSDIFARFRWTVPSPPIPEFFEQPHVQVAPSVASKYPPGHALLLTLGAWVGFHALVPLLLTGITAALIFALAARLTNPWTALVTWIVWLTTPIVLRFQPSYFSEITTTTLVLASWWLLLDWRESHKRSALLWMALVIGWGAITRPLTMLVFAIPIGVVVIRDTVRLRGWRDLGLAFAVGVAVLSVLPVWSWRTTGDWRLSPVEKYRLDYLPYDKIGFTLDTTPPRRGVTTAFTPTFTNFLVARSAQTLSEAPATAYRRAMRLTIGLFQKARLPLIMFVLVGLVAAGPARAALRFGALSAVMMYLAHLPYAHHAGWTLYYLETMPTFAALIAVGIAAVARKVAGEGRLHASLALAAAVIAMMGVQAVQDWRIDHRIRSSFYRRFAAQLKTLPAERAIVFVTYSPRAAIHISVVYNSANLNAEPVWVVHSLGPRNAELRRLAPDRATFDFNEDDLMEDVRRP